MLWLPTCPLFPAAAPPFPTTRSQIEATLIRLLCSCGGSPRPSLGVHGSLTSHLSAKRRRHRPGSFPNASTRRLHPPSQLDRAAARRARGLPRPLCPLSAPQQHLRASSGATPAKPTRPLPTRNGLRPSRLRSRTCGTASLQAGSSCQSARPRRWALSEGVPAGGSRARRPHLLPRTPAYHVTDRLSQDRKFRFLTVSTRVSQLHGLDASASCPRPHPRFPPPRRKALYSPTSPRVLNDPLSTWETHNL